MKIPEFAKRASAEINRIPLWAAFLFYQILILIRIAVEMGEAVPAIFVMQLAWFDCVLMFFVINFKYLLKLKNKDLPVLALGGFLTYIPMVYSVAMDHKWRLNFIEPVSFKQVVSDMLTLLAVHEYNWPMFPELLLLLIGSFVMALILSGRIVRSLLAAFLSVYMSFFCLGFSWMAVNPEHPSFSHWRSALSDPTAYTLVYLSFFAILALMAFWREVIVFIKQNDVKSRALLFSLCAVSTIFMWLFLFVIKKDPFVIDYILLFIPALSLSLTLFCALKKNWKMMFLPFWIVIQHLLLLF